MCIPIMTPKPLAIETSELRKRVRALIDNRRKQAAERRVKRDEAAAAYRTLLESTATPLVQMLVNTLRAEGYSFTVFTPDGGLRMAPSRSADDFIEFALETSQGDPFVALRVSRTRGRRVIQHERPVKDRTPVDALSEEDVLQALFDELGPFVER
jgi:hypothetical protein